MRVFLHTRDEGGTVADSRRAAWLLDGSIAFDRFLLMHPNERRLQLSQGEIGYLWGIARRRANQALRLLEEAKLLRIEYGGVTVLDVEGLKRYGG